jgi:hypothetical protein
MSTSAMFASERGGESVDVVGVELGDHEPEEPL